MIKSLIAYFIIFVLMTSFSCHHKQTPHQSNADNTLNNNNGNTTSHDNPSSKDTILFSNWYVKGCAERAAKGDTKFSPSNDFPDLMYPLDNYIKSDGDSIAYNRYEEHLCCREVRVTTQRHGNIITITEYWFRQGCKCKCSSMVHAVIYDLPKGEYQVYAIATGTDPVDDKPTTGRDTVMGQKIFIR
ncbi:MAG TPA: hypothetical protein VN451_11245 [Chitinophagaceae bacterium]|nr:hypothetical protein [Chitinophagaceae bacterium]